MASDVPHEVTVGPHRFSIVHDDALADRGVNGETYRERCRILIAAGLASTVEREVVLHETLHALWGGTALASADHGAHHLEEQVCHALAPPLLDLLRDNPDLVRYLTGKAGA